MKRLLALVCLVIFVDSMGYGVVVPVMPVYARDLGIGELGLGMLFASYAIGNIAAALPFGAVSDRLGRRPFLVFGMAAMAGAFVLYAYSTTYAALFLSRFLDGVTAAANWSVGLAVIADIYPAGERGRGMGVVMGAMGAGAIAGPAMGGLAYDLLGYRAPFLIVAALCGAAAALALFSGDLKGLATRVAVSGFYAAARKVLARQGMALILAVVMMGTVTLGLLEPLFPVYLEERMGLGSTAIGLLFALTVAAYTLTSPLAGRLADRFSRKHLVAWGLLSAAVAGPALVLAGNKAALALLFAACGIAISLFETPTLPLIADRMEGGGGEGSYGAAFGLFNIAWSVGYMLGPAAGGFLAARHGLPTAMIVVSIPLLLLAWRVWDAL